MRQHLISIPKNDSIESSTAALHGAVYNGALLNNETPMFFHLSFRLDANPPLKHSMTLQSTKRNFIVYTFTYLNSITFLVIPKKVQSKCWMLASPSTKAKQVRAFVNESVGKSTPFLPNVFPNSLTTANSIQCWLCRDVRTEIFPSIVASRWNWCRPEMFWVLRTATDFT